MRISICDHKTNDVITNYVSDYVPRIGEMIYFDNSSDNKIGGFFEVKRVVYCLSQGKFPHLCLESQIECYVSPEREIRDLVQGVTPITWTETVLERKYVSNDGWTIEREDVVIPGVNETLPKQWVLRNKKNEFVDFSQYRNDLMSKKHS